MQILFHSIPMQNMQHHFQQEDPLFSERSFGNWFLLAFTAGCVNVGGFLACQRFVTHVTGFASLFGADAALGNWGAAGAMISIPLYFLVGSMISSLLVDHRIQMKKEPYYEVAMLLVALCFLSAAILGHNGYFGIFGELVNIRNDYLLLALLCGGSGLQNALITTRSRAVIRTTHLTGLTTDLGIGIIRVFALPKSIKPSQREIVANWTRIGTIGSFILGSFLGAHMFIRYHYAGFLLPAGIAFLEIFLEFILKKKKI